VQAVWIILGVVVLAGTLVDAVDTLISTRIRSSGRWPTDLFIRFTWAPLWRLAPTIKKESRREAALSIYGPALILGLLVMWVLGQILGWALIWRGLRVDFGDRIHSFGDAAYYSGVVFGTVGFGDVVPVEGVSRFLTIVEAFSGLATMGLVIGFLPSLYSSYQAREKKLLLLDDLTDHRVTPMSLVVSIVGPDRDKARLDRFFDEWADWTAEVFESHGSFPMLMFFRSKYRGQSWVTGLGVVTDAAIAAIASFPQTDQSSALRLYRQSVRTFTELGRRFGLDPEPYEPITAEALRYGYSILQDGVEGLRPFDEALVRLNELRQPVHPYMESLIRVLVAPRGFWGVTSADDMRLAPIDEIIAAGGARSTDS
jgi:hypothetical protein